MAVLGETKPLYGFADMPVFWDYSVNFRLWVTNTNYFTNSTTFWERADRIGAYTDNASMNADTYYTLVNVTGRGYLSTIIHPILGTSTATWTTKVTIDGVAVERTINPVLDRTDTRLVFGGARATTEAALDYPWRGRYNSPWDTFASSAVADNSLSSDEYHDILPTDMAHSLGFPVVPFTNGLKVEIKQSATGPSSYLHQRAFCGYITLNSD